MNNNEIKVLIVPPTLPLDDSHEYFGGAIGNIAYNLLKHLSRFVEVYAFVSAYSLTKPLPPNLKLIRIEGKFNRIYGYVKKAKELLKNKNISVISQLYFFYGVSFNLLEEIEKYPFVIGMTELPHPQFEDEITINPFIAKLGKKMISPLFKRTLEHCDYLIAVNDAVKKLYSKFIPKENIYVIPYGVDTEHFKYSPLPKNRNILVVSRLIQRRNLDYLIEALSMIKAEYPDVKLHFVGEGPRKEILKNKAKKFGVENNVVFHGRVSGKDLPNYYKKCYVYCHLSMSDGWNQTVLEAMASGRPVITTEAPHNSMVTNGKTGYKVTLSPDIIAEKILRLFDDRNLAEKMGKTGRKVVEKYYNWDVIGKKYYEVYLKAYHM